MNKNNYYKEYIDYIQAHSKHADDCTDLLYVHHILPKALGGSNDVNNLVKLTFTEHVQAHELLFKAYFQYAKLAAHTLISMIGKENLKDKDVLSLDAIKDMQIKVDAARKLMSKRTVFDRVTLKPIRIGMFEQIPDYAVEKIPNPDGYASIINYDEFKRTGKHKFVKWNKDQELPAPNWKYVTDLSSDEKLQIFPASKKSRALKGTLRWIHEISTGRNKMVPKSLPLPEGFAEGVLFSEEAKQKQKAGGLMVAKSEQFENGGRWIYNIQTKKNKLIDKLAPLPEGYIEGVYNKKLDLQLQGFLDQIEALKAQLAVQA